eukprot:TRINITY_DN7276_c0_g1_i1.p1 TRINITY_DN7276_c0_g1~~TRINITY_DN7276_c0_g1_i1.p1  ORF type:complete len:129 (+),score=11.23 TRINITY_DN7276_c0_g1_i1:22-387(+)
MGPEPALVPVAGIGALRRLPLFQAVALRVAPAGPFLCPDEAAGAVGVTADLAPAAVLRLCGKIPHRGSRNPTGLRVPIRLRKIRADASARLGVDDGGARGPGAAAPPGGRLLLRPGDRYSH